MGALNKFYDLVDELCNNYKTALKSLQSENLRLQAALARRDKALDEALAENERKKPGETNETD